MKSQIKWLTIKGLLVEQIKGLHVIYEILRNKPATENYPKTFVVKDIYKK